MVDRIYLCFFAVLLWVTAVPCFAEHSVSALRTNQRILKVGERQPFSLPSEAARVAHDGDVVEIQGHYKGDVAVWRQSNLTLRGIGPRPHLQAGGRSAEGKAIWVIKGDRVVVENLEFSGARVPSHNGAGIRAEGAGLTIRRCYFHHNEMGLLTNPAPDGYVIIEDSEFAYNTTDTGRHGRLGHNIYIHRMPLFMLRHSVVHGARIGHQVKTRARRNEIRDNRIFDGEGGSSYLLDLAEGGHALVTENRFQQNASADNRTAIAFAPEARDSAGSHSLWVEGNSFINQGGPGIFVRNFSAAPVQLRNNQMLGSGITLLQGTGTVK